ncbi:pentatricopeptide repeat-containing protein At2g02750 [Euphorbia lathyris]|uniref:pentatricopeptide repeat-containing protein At2g02750 n=1 Tax=Euphorbia lathyris TaxID=212925 RepID=UPI0033131827
MSQKIIKLVADGFYKEALSLHSHLHSASPRTHHFAFAPLLKACAKLKSFRHGRIIHAHLIKIGFQSDVHSATALTHMYMNLNLLHDALNVFDEMPHPNLASLNATISGLSRNGYHDKAFLLFREVGFCGFRPNSVTVASALAACGSAAANCLQLHCWAIKLGVEMDIYVATSLLTTYSDCGEINLATKVFGEIPGSDRTVVSYNAIVSGFLQNGMISETLHLFKDMIECSIVKPNSVTLVSVISACATLLYLRFGRQVHGFFMKTEVNYDIMVGTTFIDMYSKLGHLESAYAVFNELDDDNKNLVTWNTMIHGMMLNQQSDRAVELFESLASQGLKPDSATWNSMIRGFAKSDNGVKAFNFFKRMQSAGLRPTLKCITSLLPACASLSDMRRGKEIHGHAVRIYINSDEFMATALIDMYMKCGCSSWARRVFDQFEIKPKDPALWNALISGYGRNGENEAVFEVFDKMLKEKVEPNSATFTGVLSVCSHTGDVDKGWETLKIMMKYGQKPMAEHFGCLVDILGRSGRLDEARRLIAEMPEHPPSVFASLLGACGHHLHSELAEEMAMKLSELKPEDPAPLVILSNIYAGLGRWGDAERIRQIINDRGLRKLPGHCSIGVA